MSTEDLNSKFIEAEAVIAKGSLRHNEPLTVSCMPGYEIQDDKTSRVYTCTEGVLPVFAECVG